MGWAMRAIITQSVGNALFNREFLLNSISDDIKICDNYIKPVYTAQLYLAHQAWQIVIYKICPTLYGILLQIFLVLIPSN